MTGAATMARRTIWLAGLLVATGGLAAVGYHLLAPDDERLAVPPEASVAEGGPGDAVISAGEDAASAGDLRATPEAARSGAASTAGTDSPDRDSGGQGKTLGEPGEGDDTVAQSAPATEPAENTRPSFDVVRVERSGEAVIAGRAVPGSEVTVLRDGQPVARTKADRRGEFVLIPDRPLAPGGGQLTLKSRDGEGREIESDQAVVLAIPAPAAKPAYDVAGDGAGGSVETVSPPAAGGRGPSDGDLRPKPLALLVPRFGNGEVRLLQEPHPETALNEGRLRLESVQYTVDGRVRVRGMGAPGDSVVLYLNGDEVGDNRIGQDGRWHIVPRVDVPPGLHTFRIEEISPDGRVVARLETPFSSQPLVASLLREDLVVVQPGGNLWTIARRTYGGGRHYDLIYRANADQIEDPDLIYPGQVFVLPERTAPVE